MKTMAWRWTLAASALGLLFAACTVTSDDPADDDAGTGGSTGGSGGSTAGTGGSTAGTGGSTAGTGGGTAGAAGSGAVTCEEIFDTSDACGACVVSKCCTESEACYNDVDAFCMTALTCMSTCDAGDPMTCAMTCDDGNINQPFNDLMTCMTDNCSTDCAAQ
jgi:hypothetical protein